MGCIAVNLSRLTAEEFISSLCIYHKEQKRLAFFDLNPAQKELLEVLQTHNRILVPKARQLGISTLIRAFFFWKAYCATEPQPYAVMSHTRASAEGLNKMDKTFYKNLPPKYQKSLGKLNTRHMVFKKSGASCDVYTAGGRGGTRSFAAAAAHLSEFAFYPNQEESIAEIEATVGDGLIVIESTANEPGDKFHRLVLDSLNGENDWYTAFYGWNIKAEYRATAPKSFEPGSDERALKEAYDLDNDQVNWRRKKLRTLGLGKFRREFPINVHEAFRAAKTPYFDGDSLDEIEPIKSGKKTHREIAEPDSQGNYVIGVDVAAGVGSDYSAITILSLDTREPVYHYEDNRLSPARLADVVIQLATKYNDPMVLVEANGYGSTTLARLEQLGYRNLWKDDKKRYFETRVKSRQLLFEHLREQLENRMFDRLDGRLLEQLQNCFWDHDKQRPDHPSDGNDDLLISFALALWACKDIPLSILHNLRASIIDQHKMKMRAKKARRSIPWRTTVGHRNRSPY